MPQLLDRGLQLLARDRGPVARLAVAVQRALLAEGEPAACRELVHRLVAGQHELGAPLDERAVREALRPDAPADAVARLEHDDLVPGTDECIGGSEARKPGADDECATQRRRALRGTAC